jgi:outer membrane protein OmpA-like peptidoglycan-associated protein
MKKSMKIVLVAILLFANCGILFGQQLWLELGDKYFDQYAYKKATKLYIGAMDRGIENWEIYAKLGDCYYYTSKTKKALENYEMAIGLNENIKPEYRLRYALTLQSIGKKDEALIELKKYNNEIESLGVRPFIKTTDSAENLYINSTFSDFGSYIFNDTMYFSSSRENTAKKKRLNKKVYKWNEQPFLDIYEAVVKRHNNSIELVPPDKSTISNSINTIAHQASVTITNDGKTMYFSGGTVINNKLEYNKNGTSTLKLQRATLDRTNTWVVTPEDIEAMKVFDLENFSIGNPALSPDNRRLFFSTCAPYSEAKGHTDIYYVDINADGSYSEVKSVPGINTNGRESFPFISKDSTLYFSSDGIYKDSLGLGLLDIYKVKNIDKVIETGKADVFHMEAPFNSDKDDFAFFVDEQKKDDECEVYAYFSSNREDPNAKGDDDIYRAKLKNPIMIKGTIKDSKTGEFLRDATVELIDSKGSILDTLQISSTGAFNFKVNCGLFYSLRGSKDRYEDDLKKFNPVDASKGISLELKPYPCLVSINYEGFENINQIEFEFNIDSIGTDAKDTLKEVLDLLLTNRDIKINIESHTDSRGTNESNIKLSKRRAENTKAYLIKEGVFENQIENAIGYGEERLCFTDEEILEMPTEKREAAHKKNRRSHFIIVGCVDNTPNCPELDPNN